MFFPTSFSLAIAIAVNSLGPSNPLDAMPATGYRFDQTFPQDETAGLVSQTTVYRAHDGSTITVETLEFRTAAARAKALSFATDLPAGQMTLGTASGDSLADQAFRTFGPDGGTQVAFGSTFGVIVTSNVDKAVGPEFSLLLENVARRAYARLGEVVSQGYVALETRGQVRYSPDGARAELTIAGRKLTYCLGSTIVADGTAKLSIPSPPIRRGNQWLVPLAVPSGAGGSD